MGQNPTIPTAAGHCCAGGEKSELVHSHPYPTVKHFSRLLPPKGDTSVTGAHLKSFKNGHLMMLCNCVFKEFEFVVE